MALTRRRLIFSLPLVAAVRPVALAAQDLGRFVVSGESCPTDPTLTPALEPDSPFRDGAPERSRLVDGAVDLVLAGTVGGKICGGIEGARIDVWHADAEGRYDASGDRFRGFQRTGAGGAFRFETRAPGALPGRTPRVNVRVRADGTADLHTAIFLPAADGPGVDPSYRPELAATILPDGTRRLATFDILLDL